MKYLRPLYKALAGSGRKGRALAQVRRPLRHLRLMLPCRTML